MHNNRYKLLFLLLIPLFLIFLPPLESEAQGYSIRKRSPMRMPNNRKMRIICPIFVPNEYPYQGIGIKVGDPFAFTYKLYVSKFFAVEIAVGSGASFAYKKFYMKNFFNFESFDSLNYLSHSVRNDLAGQFRLMIHYPVESIKGLDWYVGAGYQFKNTSILYRYNDPDANGFSMEAESRQSQFFYGPDAFLGLEYANFSIPVSIFFESGIFVIIDSNGLGPRFQATAGVRYIF